MVHGRTAGTTEARNLVTCAMMPQRESPWERPSTDITDKLWLGAGAGMLLETYFSIEPFRALGALQSRRSFVRVLVLLQEMRPTETLAAHLALELARLVVSPNMPV